MPYGARWSLSALALSLVLGIPVASAQQAATGHGRTWIDPPGRQPDTAEPAAAPAQAAAQVAPSPTPAAAPTVPTSKGAGAPPRPSRQAAVRRPPARPAAVVRREATGAKRIAVAGRRVRVAAVPRIRAERQPRVVAATRAARLPQEAGFTRYRPFGSAPGETDERLERLGSAAAAGYLVVHRRSVEFPDGRSLRTYPLEDGGYD